jgi:sulfite exporter TauE/SafE
MIRWQGLGGFLSLISGIALLLYGMQYAGWLTVSRSPEILPAQMLKNVWYKAIQSPNKAWFFPAGIANGLLPCGMVYAAATVALGMSQFEESIGVMLGFAAGTLPVFLVLPLVRRYIGGRKITPWIMIAAALWLMYRGGSALYALAQQKATNPMCHGADFTSF